MKFTGILMVFLLVVVDVHAARDKPFSSLYKSHSVLIPKGLAEQVSSDRGKILIVHFWATWCPPCKAEMAKLDSLAQTLDNRYKILPLSNDRYYAKVVPEFYAKHSIKHLEVMSDPGASYAKSLKVRGLPSTIIIGTHGKVIGKLEGPVDWQDPKVLEYLHKFYNGEEKVD